MSETFASLIPIFFNRLSGNRSKVTYRASLGKPIVPTVVEKRSLHMQEGTYRYRGTHFCEGILHM